jgi:hypothetical protein
LNNENIEIILSISSQLGTSSLFNYCTEFLGKIDQSNSKSISTILSNSALLSEKFDIHSIVSKNSADFEIISFQILSIIPPSGISKIRQSPKLKLEKEDSIFEYSKEWKDLSIPLFWNDFFEYLSEEKLSKFFLNFQNSIFLVLSLNLFHLL